MSDRDLKREILLHTIKADMANGTDDVLDILKKQYPALSSEECLEIRRYSESRHAHGAYR